MAINYAEKAEGRIVELVVCGKLQSRDYEHFVPQIEQAIQRHGKIRILMQMVDFHGWTGFALWEDIKFDWQHFRDVERLAMVGEKSWEKGMAVFCRPFTTAEIRYFDVREIDAARAWIEEGLAVKDADA